MADEDKPTEASKTELSEEQLDDAQGGGGVDYYLKLDTIETATEGKLKLKSAGGESRANDNIEIHARLARKGK